MYYIHYYHPPSVIHSDMVYDPEYMTGLYPVSYTHLTLPTTPYV